jgi:diacylglycerol kinase (ATP)
LISSKTIAILVNPLAGRGKHSELLSAIASDLERRGVNFFVFIAPWKIETDDFTHIYILGGDGTINHFINQYPSCRTPVSLFNTGTGNDFYWKLHGIPGLAHQLEIAFSGDEKRIDAGVCNGRYFVNGAGVGFDGSVVNCMKRSRNILTGLAGYYFSVIKMILKYRSTFIEVMADGQPIPAKQKTFMVTVANGSRYGGDFVVAPDASVYDGSFDLVIVEGLSVLSRLMHLPKMKKGKHITLPFVHHRHAQVISITSNTPLTAHLDGELMIDTRFNIRLLPGKFIFRC